METKNKDVIAPIISITIEGSPGGLNMYIKRVQYLDMLPPTYRADTSTSNGFPYCVTYYKQTYYFNGPALWSELRSLIEDGIISKGIREYSKNYPDILEEGHNVFGEIYKEIKQYTVLKSQTSEKSAQFLYDL